MKQMLYESAREKREFIENVKEKGEENINQGKET